MEEERKIVQAIFYSDKSKESEKARELLIQAGLRYEEVEKHGLINGDLNGKRPPLVRAREGEFEGVKRIEEFVSFVLATA